MGLARRAEVGIAPAIASAPWLSSPQHELVYALLSRVAARLDIDIVFIKGPILHAQGLRSREHSGDVDCWVRPGQDIRLAEAMRAWGWRPFYSAFTGTDIPHSLSLFAGGWGCAVDVHTRFPGMNLDPVIAFEQVLATSERRTFAGNDLRTPSRPVGAVIFALHEMRPADGLPPSVAKVASAVSTLRAAGADAIAASGLLGAGYVLNPVLQDVFPDARIELSRTGKPPHWDLREMPMGPRKYLRAVGRIRARDRVRVLFRLIWPSKDMVHNSQLVKDEEFGHETRARLRRLRIGACRFLRGK
ncbi:hypothetical protein L2X99_10495 [Microbacterium sp. KUDC0406]|uniref:hypothetical protein n=1 Tax=Microbacterium sp. KUDC0406 TaxID=2909588 RepID=UPI001F1E6A8E|nr:hypothetical protein [Microbacterium sp. KUDC0406]UJP08910.1 hypothetical protein L2X99_10495 [Microbacterium sp. KUDC0406]